MADTTDLFASDEAPRVCTSRFAWRSLKKPRCSNNRSRLSCARRDRLLSEELTRAQADRRRLGRARGRGRLSRRAGHQAHSIDVSGRRARQRVGHPYRPDERCLRIRQRVDGCSRADLRRQSRAAALVTRLKSCAASTSRRSASRRRPLQHQDRRSCRRSFGDDADLSRRSHSMLRLLDHTSSRKTFAELGMPPTSRPVREMTERSAGMILVTGPGSGKTTTLYALQLQHVNSPTTKVSRPRIPSSTGGVHQ